MRRSAVLLVLLAAAALGFARAEQLKLERAPIGAPHVRTHFSVTCTPGPRCDGTHQAHMSFTLRRPGRVSLAIVTADGNVVRDLGSGRRPKGRLEIDWDGRDDAGRRVPDGSYRLRVDAGGKEITIPDPVVLDDVPPRVTPLGHGHPLRFRLSEQARVVGTVYLLGANGKATKRIGSYRAPHRRLRWRSFRFPPGTRVLIVLRATDRAGNHGTARTIATA